MKIRLGELRRLIREALGDEDVDKDLRDESVFVGRLAKSFFEMQDGPSKFRDMIKMHWVSTEENALKFLEGNVAGEVSVNILPRKSKVSRLSWDWGEVGLQVDGQVTLYCSHDMFSGNTSTWGNGEKFPVLDGLFWDFPDNYENIFKEGVSKEEKIQILEELGFEFDPPAGANSHNEGLVKDPVVISIYVPESKKEKYSNLILLAKERSIPVRSEG
jgi:hypothetical protein